MQIKTRHYDRHNMIYVKAWYSHDNSLGQAKPVTASLANGVMGRCQINRLDHEGKYFL